MSSIPFSGGLAVGVPGELRGYQVAHKKYGRVKWAELFQPTIKLCRNGITISKYLDSVFQDRARNDILTEPTLRYDKRLALLFNFSQNAPPSSPPLSRRISLS